MRVTEKLVNSPEKEGVTLEYIKLTKDFEEIKEYVMHKGLYARMENGEEILITRRYAKEVEDCFMEDEADERI